MIDEVMGKIGLTERGCPDCGEPWRDPYRESQCSLNRPLMICIPPGQHIHLPCPVHGSHRINGSNVTL